MALTFHGVKTRHSECLLSVSKCLCRAPSLQWAEPGLEVLRVSAWRRRCGAASGLNWCLTLAAHVFSTLHPCNPAPLRCCSYCGQGRVLLLVPRSAVMCILYAFTLTVVSRVSSTWGRAARSGFKLQSISLELPASLSVAFAFK